MHKSKQPSYGRRKGNLENWKIILNWKEKNGREDRRSFKGFKRSKRRREDWKMKGLRWRK